MLRKVLLIMAILLGGQAAAPLGAANPVVAGFDCAKAATRIERAICSDPELASEDRDLAQLYQAAQTSAWGKGPSNQPQVQREWIANRNGCSGPKVENLKSCLMMSYHQRNGDLAVAVLLTSPDLAIPVLKRVKPQMADLYQAIARYTELGPGRDARIDALLLPYWNRLQSGDWHYGQSIVEDTIKSPADITRSDKHFGLFAYVVSAYLGDDEEVISHPFPCAALIRRSGLVAAVSPVFGSTFDNFALYDDCSSTLPPQPRLDALIQNLTLVDLDCEQGTIRFALYKDSALEIASARIGLSPGPGRAQPIPRRLARLAGPAIAELADQYWRYAGMDKATAQRRARIWIGNLANYRASCGE